MLPRGHLKCIDVPNSCNYVLQHFISDLGRQHVYIIIEIGPFIGGHVCVRVCMYVDVRAFGINPKTF